MIFSIAFVCHIDVHNQYFFYLYQIVKNQDIINFVLSIVAYGVIYNAFTINALYTRGLFA